ncbi:MAG: ADP-ribosylglycohydrolase family protein [bacterium]|nr:ADP-ribosylglycohydrolase family protein [bacterium]
MSELEDRLRGAWQGRVSGCMLGKAVEAFSMTSGHESLMEYLGGVDALPLRDYIPLAEDPPPLLFEPCCRGRIEVSSPDDDINYSVLALEMLEKHGADLSTEDVAREWINKLPAGMTFTAERAAYRALLAHAHEYFSMGAAPGFDLALCSDNEYNDWIGAQIRADLYGWVNPGNPEQAVRLARADAALSHRGDGVHGAVIVAGWGAAIPESESLEVALDRATHFIPDDSGAARAVELGRRVALEGRGADEIHEAYADLSPLHTNNNLALVVWALLSHAEDFGAAIGDVVAAGWDTDCNGATVGALWAMQGEPVPAHWCDPWQERVGVSLAGQGELVLGDLVARTVRVAEALAV